MKKKKEEEPTLELAPAAPGPKSMRDQLKAEVWKMREHSAAMRVKALGEMTVKAQRKVENMKADAGRMRNEGFELARKAKETEKKMQVHAEAMRQTAKEMEKRMWG